MRYPKIQKGKYKDWPIDEVPLDYLHWYIRVLRAKLGQYNTERYLMFKSLVEYFLSKSIRVEYYLSKNVERYHFYIDEYVIHYPKGKEIEWGVSYIESTNSKGNLVYSIGTSSCPLYVEYDGTKYTIAPDQKYREVSYHFGQTNMIIENTSEYKFIDGVGRTRTGYLLRMPYIPETSMEKFEVNIKV